MVAVSRLLANDATSIHHFYGDNLQSGSQEAALIAAVHGLREGEILRLSIDQNPLDLIQKIAIRYGAKLIFQYLQNRDGAVIIDFKKVYD